jgi:hypothetical protein
MKGAKMRLIDADVLQKEYQKEHGKRLLLIDVAPTVDAIPWEKLERYAEFFCADVPYTEFVREAKQFCLDAERSEDV